MNPRNRSLGPGIGFPAFLILIVPAILAAQNPRVAIHPAVGSWFGRAVQLCVEGVPCPQAVLYMTPTLTRDGAFLGNDSLSIGGLPFGPHTTAHGQWVATSPWSIGADYVFMLPADPALEVPSVIGLRFRWQARVTSRDTMVGLVNVWFAPPLPLTWEPLGQDQFPAMPKETESLVTPPAGFVSDPALCQAPGCPLVFKFTIRRVETGPVTSPPRL